MIRDSTWQFSGSHMMHDPTIYFSHTRNRSWRPTICLCQIRDRSQRIAQGDEKHTIDSHALKLTFWNFKKKSYSLEGHSNSVFLTVIFIQCKQNLFNATKANSILVSNRTMSIHSNIYPMQAKFNREMSTHWKVTAMFGHLVIHQSLLCTLAFLFLLKNKLFHFVGLEMTAVWQIA
jgi:hypothetical protein